MKKVVCLLAAYLISTIGFAQGYHLEGNQVNLDGMIVFETGTAKIKAESEESLANIKKYLDDKSYISLLRVEGHVSGSAKNQALSEARANSVCAWLVGKGIDCKRLIAVGFGDTKPVSEMPAANTRITFVNAALRGHAIGGMPVDGGGNVAGDPCK